ncbi:MAG: hypothetical protein R3B84_06440 [Zavarzinella sp.]
MNMISKYSVVAIVVAAGFFSGSAANAQSCAVIDRLALQLDRQARGVHAEVDAHFKNTPLYRHLHEDIEQMEALAGQIHELATRNADFRTMKVAVHDLDKLNSHISGLVDQLRFHPCDQRAYIHLKSSVLDLDRTIVAMQNELYRTNRVPVHPVHGGHGFPSHGGGFPRHGHGGFQQPVQVIPQPVVVQQPVFVPPTKTITIGKGNFRLGIQIR